MLPVEKIYSQGPQKLRNWELLSILFGHGTTRENVFTCAKRIISDYGLIQSSQTHPLKLRESHRLTRLQAAKLSACFELSERINQGAGGLLTFNSSDKVIEYVSEMKLWQKENFRALYLNSRLQLIRDEIISVGNLNTSSVHPRELFSPALKFNAASLILLHNHPSGYSEPSPEDLATTKILLGAADIMHIPIIDHVIIAKNDCYSFKEHGLIEIA